MMKGREKIKDKIWRINKMSNVKDRTKWWTKGESSSNKTRQCQISNL